MRRDSLRSRQRSRLIGVDPLRPFKGFWRQGKAGTPRVHSEQRALLLGGIRETPVASPAHQAINDRDEKHREQGVAENRSVHEHPVGVVPVGEVRPHLKANREDEEETYCVASRAADLQIVGSYAPNGNPSLEPRRELRLPEREKTRGEGHAPTRPYAPRAKSPQISSTTTP